MRLSWSFSALENQVHIFKGSLPLAFMSTGVKGLSQLQPKAPGAAFPGRASGTPGPEQDLAAPPTDGCLGRRPVSSGLCQRSRPRDTRGLSVKGPLAGWLTDGRCSALSYIFKR